MPGYDYASADDIERKETVEEAVRSTVINYFHYQLGWPREKCDQRMESEINREIPKGLFDNLRVYRNWELGGARLVDVGAGQGGGVLEALHRGADAHGVEPGPEFAALARRRLDEDGFDPERIHRTGGEDLPFPDNRFDYAISLQVLEHVVDPRPLLQEMYRVLKPGGQAVVRCENYLAFREQHYRVPWLPMLPKSIGSAYLRSIGRDPSFLKDYVYYTTYPQVWNLSSKIGFENITYNKIMFKAKNIDCINSEVYRGIAKVLQPLPDATRSLAAYYFMHAKNLFSVGVNLNLLKPEDQ